MSTQGERYAAAPVAPTQSTTPGIGITRLASSATAAKEDISGYKHLYGKRLVLKNESTTAGDALFVSFSASGSTDVSAAATAGASVAAGTTADQGLKILPGESVIVTLNQNDHKFIHWDALANTPVLCIYPAGRGVGRV